MSDFDTFMSYGVDALNRVHGETVTHTYSGGSESLTAIVRSEGEDVGFGQDGETTDTRRVVQIKAGDAGNVGQFSTFTIGGVVYAVESIDDQVDMYEVRVVNVAQRLTGQHPRAQ